MDEQMVPPPVMPVQLSEDSDSQEFFDPSDQILETEEVTLTHGEQQQSDLSEEQQQQLEVNSNQSSVDPEEEDPTITCQICFNKIQIFTIAQCNHGVCLTCMLRIKTKLQLDC